ncbi:MAG: DUF4410 domain-containing protein, partial [Candidatus Methylacidiphilales bacterium]
KKVAYAVRLPQGSTLPPSGWLLTGKFVRVNQGSRALRMIVGLGAGGTKLETEIAVRDLSQPGAPVVISTMKTGGSNAEPGAMFSMTSTAATMPLQAEFEERSIVTAMKRFVFITDWSRDAQGAVRMRTVGRPPPYRL